MGSYSSSEEGSATNVILTTPDAFASDEWRLLVESFLEQTELVFSESELLHAFIVYVLTSEDYYLDCTVESMSKDSDIESFNRMVAYVDRFHQSIYEDLRVIRKELFVRPILTIDNYHYQNMFHIKLEGSYH